MSEAETPIDPQIERRLAVELFNRVWDLLDANDFDGDAADEMVHAAHASRYHWGRVGEPVNLVRGEWQISRVYAVLGRHEPALHHARRCLELCEANGIGDFDLAFAHEAMARAYRIGGMEDQAGAHLDRARQVGDDIADEEDKEHFLNELASLVG